MDIKITRKKGNLTPEKFLIQKKTRGCTNPDCENVIKYTFQQVKDGEPVKCSTCGTEILLSVK
jgi:hypothetical protein